MRIVAGIRRFGRGTYLGLAVPAALGVGLAVLEGCVFDPGGIGRSDRDGGVCGDGIVDGAEGCDDGNTEDGDGCSALCQVEAGWECAGEPSVCSVVCGDGLIMGAETCDDGNGDDGDGCSALCEMEPGWICAGEPSVCADTCGNFGLDQGEACDDGNIVDGDGCTANCQVEPGYVCTGEPSVCVFSCGNGSVDSDEGCDDGNMDDGDGCSSVCVVEEGWFCTGEPSACSARCGDGLIVGPETCDDGNNTGFDGCSSFCQQEAGWACVGEPSTCTTVCGDGVIVGTEECDDGGTTGNDGCSASCVVESGWQCIGQPSVCTLVPGEWFNTNWLYRKRIAIGHAGVAGDLQDFPVLIHIPSDSDLDFRARDDGYDIVFTLADGTTKLSHEIQRYNHMTGELIAWVRVPFLSSTADTFLYMYYGYDNAQNQQDVFGVWVNGYEAVLHLQESGDGNDDEFLDSSGNGHHGTGGGVSGAGDSSGTPTRQNGLFGYAQDFDDSNTSDQIRLDLLDDQAWTEVTVQAWIRPDDGGDDRVFAKTWGFGLDEAVWQLGKTNVAKIRMRTDAAYEDFVGGSAFANGQWAHFAFTWQAGAPGTVTVYRNGSVEVAGNIAGSVLYTQSPDPEPTIGNTPAGDRGFDGRMQEVRLSAVARSVQWLQTEYNNQSSPQTFLSVDVQETQ